MDTYDQSRRDFLKKMGLTGSGFAVGAGAIEKVFAYSASKGIASNLAESKLYDAEKRSFIEDITIVESQKNVLQLQKDTKVIGRWTVPDLGSVGVQVGKSQVDIAKGKIDWYPIHFNDFVDAYIANGRFNLSVYGIQGASELDQNFKYKRGFELNCRELPAVDRIVQKYGNDLELIISGNLFSNEENSLNGEIGSLQLDYKFKLK